MLNDLAGILRDRNKWEYPGPPDNDIGEDAVHLRAINEGVKALMLVKAMPKDERAKYRQYVGEEVKFFIKG